MSGAATLANMGVVHIANMTAALVDEIGNQTTVQAEIKSTMYDAAIFYFGDSSTDGTWRIVPSGNNLNLERRESGVYVSKSVFTP